MSSAFTELIPFCLIFNFFAHTLSKQSTFKKIEKFDIFC